jgi:glutamate-1-semialdehyde 2,1-aminomutase
MKLAQSNKYHQKLCQSLAGAVHYNFRCSWQPNGIVFRSGKGNRIQDLDGNEYLDFYGNFGSNILGHCHQQYLSSLFSEMSRVSSTCMSDLSERVCNRISRLVGCAERIRFSISGTEAVLAAVRIARAWTSKKKLVRMTGCYHGHADLLLGGRPFSKELPYPVSYSSDPRGSEGIDEDVRCQQSYLVPYNDYRALENLIKAHGKSIACIIMEPIALNAGGIEPEPDYLEKIRSLADKSDVVLIFDEVITGFRVSLGGAQKIFGVQPDLAVFAKALGGGALPVSAVAGRKKLMSLLEQKRVVHAGTFNGYHAGMAAIDSNLNILEDYDRKALQRTNRMGAAMRRIIKKEGYKLGIPITTQGHDMAFCVHVTENKLLCAEQWSRKIKEADALLQQCFQKKGILTAPLLRFYPSIALNDLDLAMFRRRTRRAMQNFAKAWGM